MEKCKVSNCLRNLSADKDYQGGILCSKHNNKNTKETVEFSTWFSDKCATIITDSYKIWLTIYKPKKREIEGSLFKEVIKNEQTFAKAQKRSQKIRDILSENNFCTNPVFVSPKVDKNIDWWGPLYPLDRLEGILDTFVIRSYLQNVNNPDNHIEPLDVLAINRGLYKHFVIYLGKGWICNYNRERGTFLDTWNNFLTGRSSSLSSDYNYGNYGNSSASVTRFHAIIPFKSQEKIVEQVVKAILVKMGKQGSGINEYCLSNRNCEHFVNSCAFGIDFSQQANEKSSSVKNFCSSSNCCENKPANNGKSSVCIKNEIRLSNEKLDELTKDKFSEKEIEKEKLKISQYIYEARIESFSKDIDIITKLVISSNWDEIKNGW